MSGEFGSKTRDRALGMGARITRRDFLNGVALTAGAAIIPAMIPPEMWAAAAADFHPGGPKTGPPGTPGLEAQGAPGYYPPGKTGLRGDHAGSFEAAHKLRDGARSEEHTSELQSRP